MFTDAVTRNLAVENNIQPNLLRNWKKEFLEKAAVVFDDTREENIKEKLAENAKKRQLLVGHISHNFAVIFCKNIEIKETAVQIVQCVIHCK